MKKVSISFLAVLFTFAMALTSCSGECKTCKASGFPDQEFCESDFFGDPDGYKDAIKILESTGWKCK